MKNSKNVKRFNGNDFSTAENVFKTAQFLLPPEDQTQKMAFRKLLPYIYTMRNNGSSWDQLTKLLKECGFDLTKSSIRTYYAEMVAECEDELKQQLAAHTLMFEEIRKLNEGKEIKSIAGRVKNYFDAKRSDSYN